MVSWQEKPAILVRGVQMNEELSYAEMLEIPIETVTVKRKEKKHRKERSDEADAGDLSDRLVEQVNSRMEEDDPAYAQSTPIERVSPVKKPRPKLTRALLWGEFAAVCVLCATIFLTNIFMTDSAINTFVRGLFHGTAQAADTRTYSDFTLSPVVSAYDDVEIAVSETGVLSFEGKCSIYAPCAGKIAAVHGNENEGYSVEIKHSDTFSTVMSGLDSVYIAEGDNVYANIPVAYSKGENTVRVMFYDGEKLLSNISYGDNGLSWS